MGKVCGHDNFTYEIEEVDIFIAWFSRSMY